MSKMQEIAYTSVIPSAYCIPERLLQEYQVFVQETSQSMDGRTSPFMAFLISTCLCPLQEKALTCPAPVQFACQIIILDKI